MDAERYFLMYCIGCCLLTWICSCWIIEKQMVKAKRKLERSEERRKRREHDDYCTEEVRQLYEKGKWKWRESEG